MDGCNKSVTSDKHQPEVRTEVFLFPKIPRLSTVLQLPCRQLEDIWSIATTNTTLSLLFSRKVFFLMKRLMPTAKLMHVFETRLKSPLSISPASLAM